MGTCINEKKSMHSINPLKPQMTQSRTYQKINHNAELNQKKSHKETLRIQELVIQPHKQYKKVLAEKESNLPDPIKGQSEVKQYGSRTNVLVRQPTEKEYLQYIKSQLQKNSPTNQQKINPVIQRSMTKSDSSRDSNGEKKQKQWQKSEQNTKQSKIVKELIPADPQSCVNVRLSNSHLNIPKPYQNVSRINIQV